MAELTVRTRVALLAAIALAATAVAWYFWPARAPEPSGVGVSVIDTPAEKELLKQMIREGKIRLVKPDEFDAQLNDEQKAMVKRRSGGG